MTRVVLCGPRPVRVRGDVEDVHVAEPTSMTNRQHRRDSRAARHVWHLKINPSRTPQATTAQARKIKVNNTSTRR
jgi:hypothetical protein